MIVFLILIVAILVLLLLPKNAVLQKILSYCVLLILIGIMLFALFTNKGILNMSGVTTFNITVTSMIILVLVVDSKLIDYLSKKIFRRIKTNAGNTAEILKESEKIARRALDRMSESEKRK